MRLHLLAIGVLAAAHHVVALSLYVMAATRGSQLRLVLPLVWPVLYVVGALAESPSNAWWIHRSAIILSGLVWAIALYALWSLAQAIRRGRRTT